MFVITKSNIGGAQTYVYDLATSLKNLNFEVAVASGGSGGLRTRIEAKAIPYFEIDNLSNDINLLKEWRSLLSLYKIIKTFRPDVIHLNSSKAGVLGAIVARMVDVPKIVFTAHGWPFLEKRSRGWRLMAWLGSYLTALLVHEVILISKNDLQQTKMPGVKHKCHVIHPSLPEVTLQNRADARASLYDSAIIERHSASFWLVTHGELNHNKNLLTAINAVAEFNSNHNTKIFYTIIGTGVLEAELKAEVEMKGMNDHISFLGYLPDAREYLSAFDVYVLPSQKEGLPISLLEAGLAGLIVIASRVGGIPEVIIDRETGLLSDPNNHMSIVSAFEYLLENPDDRDRFVQNLQTKVRSEFTLNEMVAKTLTVYKANN